MTDTPDALNKIVDVVLAYKPKPKTKAAKKRKRLKTKKDKQDRAPEQGGLVAPEVP